MLFYLRQPHRNTQEAFSVCQVKDHDNAISSLVVCIGDRAVPFLASCIPNLQLDRRLIDLEGAEPEVNTDRAQVVLLEAIVLAPSKESEGVLKMHLLRI